MFQEIIASFLSLFSAVTLETPHISREENCQGNQTEQSTSYISRHNIFREYVSGLHEDHLSSQAEYVQLENELLNKPTYIQSLYKSLKTTFTQTLAVLPLVLMGIALIYFDLRTTDLCSEWKGKNYTLYADVRRMTLFGKGVQSVIVYPGFFLIFIVLFGWNDFKRHYSSTILISLLNSSIYTLYSSFFLLYEADKSGNTLVTYDLPLTFMFVVFILLQCGIVVRKIRQNHPTVSYTYCHIFTVLAVPLFSICAMAHFYIHCVVKWFNSLDDVWYRLILSLLSPALALLQTALCRHIALWHTSGIIESGRSFALVYFIRAVFITLYRIMQSNFVNIWLFVGLSLLSSLAGFLRTVTARIRTKAWARVIKFLNKTCCSRLHHLPGDTPHHRRLKADIEIQNLFFENISIILSQSCIVLYGTINFHLSDWSIVKTSLMRITIGLGIEFVFNILSTFVRIHWYDIPVARVWSKFWKRHLFATGITVAVFACFFTKNLLIVLEKCFHETSTGENYVIRNCTLPYESWR